MGSYTRLHRGSLDTINGKLLPIDKTDLEIYYAMWENDGTTAYDESKNGNDGTINGSTWDWSSTFAKPILSFDNTDDQVDIPDRPALSAYTVIHAVRWNQVATDNNRTFAFRRNNQVEARSETDGNFYFYQNPGTDWISVSDSVTANTWYMISCWWDGSDIYLKINDRAPVSAACPDMAYEGNNDALGYNGTVPNAYPMDGDLLFWMFFPVAKSESYISTLYNKIF